VIGASDKKGSIGHALIRNIQKGGYKGKIFPINARYPVISGLSAYPSIGDVGQSVDLTVIATPIKTVPFIIGECVRAGVKGVIIISAGGERDRAEGHRDRS